MARSKKRTLWYILDLKELGNTIVLWMVCAFSKLIKEVVLKDETADSVTKGLNGGWCMNY